MSSYAHLVYGVLCFFGVQTSCVMMGLFMIMVDICLFIYFLFFSRTFRVESKHRSDTVVADIIRHV